MAKPRIPRKKPDLRIKDLFTRDPELKSTIRFIPEEVPKSRVISEEERLLRRTNFPVKKSQYSLKESIDLINSIFDLLRAQRLASKRLEQERRVVLGMSQIADDYRERIDNLNKLEKENKELISIDHKPIAEIMKQLFYNDGILTEFGKIFMAIKQSRGKGSRDYIPFILTRLTILKNKSKFTKEIALLEELEDMGLILNLDKHLKAIEEQKKRK